MDSHSPYPHRHTGYAASRPHQPPPPPPSFSDNRNFYGPYRPNLIAPLLRPAPPPYRVVPTPQPPPPSYNHSHNPQFTSNKPNNDYHRRSSFLQSPPRVLHHLPPPPPPLEDGFPLRLSQFERYSNDPPPQPRVLSDHWPARPYPTDDFNPKAYHRQFDNRPMSPIANIRHELDSNISSRVIEKQIVGDESYQFRIQFGLSSDGSLRDYRVSDHGPLSRVFYSNSGNYDNRRAFPYGRDREVMRDVRDPLMEIGGSGINDREGIRVFAGKREHFRSREVNTELERHSVKRSREGSQEFNRNHRKQMPKRSAFLRIQKPSYKNREDDTVGFSGYFDNSKSSSFGAKDQNLYSDCGSGEQVREGSPVELDVSFKSNSLVAKAIVTPPSSSGISETDMTPRKSKIRRMLVPNKDIPSSSSHNKDNGKLDSSGLNKDSVKLDGSPHVPNNAPSSEEGLNPSIERLVSALVSKGNNSSPVPGSSGTNVFPAKSKMESSDGCILSDKDGTDVVSGEMSAVKVMKKKKVVKKVVKRAASSSLASSPLQLTKKFDEQVRGDSSACCLPVTSEPDKASAMASIDEVDHQNSSNEVAVMPECGKADRLANSTVSEQVAIVSGSDGLCELNSIRKRRCSASPASSSNEETKFHGSLLNTSLYAASNADKESFKLQNKISNTEIGGVIEPQNLDSFMPEENSTKGSPEVLPPTEGNSDSLSFSFAKSKTQVASSTSNDTAVELGNCFLDSQERIVDIGCPLVEKGSLDQFASVNLPAGSSQMLHKSNSGETSIQNFLTSVDCSNHEVGIGCDNGCTSSERLEFDSHETVDDIGTQSVPNGSSIPVKNVSRGAYLNTGISVGGDEQDAFNFENNSKIFEMPWLDLSKSVINKAFIGPLNDAWVDTTLRLSFKDSSPAECGISGDGCADLDLQPCADVTSDSHQYNSGKISDIKASVSSRDDISPDRHSPRDQKKRKFSAVQSEVFGPTASNVGDRPIIAGLSASACEVAFNTVDALEKQEEITDSGMDSLCDSELHPLPKGITALPNNFSRGRDLENLVAARDAFQDYGLKWNHCSSVVRELAVSQEQSTCQDLGGEQVVNATPDVDGGSHQNGSIDIGSAEGGTMDLEAAEEQQPSTESRTAPCQGSLELQSLDRDEKVPKRDIENGRWGGNKNDLPFTLNDLCTCGDGNEVPTNNSSTEFVPDIPSDTDSPESLPDVVGSLLNPNSGVKSSSVDKIPLEKQASEHGCHLSTHLSSSHNPNLHAILDDVGDKLSLTKNTEFLSAQETKSSSALDAIGGELYGRKSLPHHVVSKVYPGCSSLVSFASKKASSSAHIAKPRTWHRTYNPSTSASHRNKAMLNTVSTQRQFLRKIPKPQGTSYVRKGNSLVRQTTSMAVQSQGSHGLSPVYQLNSLGIDEVKKNSGSDSSTDVVDPANVMRTGGINTSFERPRTHSLPSAPKIPNHLNNLLVDCRSSPLQETGHCDPTENASGLTEPGETKSAAKSSEDLLKFSEALSHGEINNLELGGLNNGNSLTSNVASMTYVKRNSNQLVASSNPSALSGHNTPATVSDSYYKRRENQLIRTSVESPSMQMVNFLDDLNSEGIIATRSFSKRSLQKVEPKTCKPSKFSLVWTLRGAQSSKNDGNSLHYKKLLPQLFPWKRATHWRSFGPNLASNSANSSLSTIGKLLLLRNRNAVYTRSRCGFSLRKSKVLSVGGCSLKWSKSIERRSKKASEEATLAVAAAERMKKEQSGATSVVSGTKNKRERIFRIGSVRYKMDSSRRTLQRVSDDKSLLTAADQMEKDGKKSYVPRRLIIGKDEYVRIGNGNQLIRNPKKRTRILASEKVRWSLHTARSRLARKRKYCQFFTRFGKCNKDDGKCPYIHDSSKIAVCTKFLNGQCSSSDCKLTHKIIPERMPDCSYFLQGLCTNKNCPYRHVHVNPSASICEGFLRGYCADGNELKVVTTPSSILRFCRCSVQGHTAMKNLTKAPCECKMHYNSAIQCRKKHSYVCPIYEATGSCPQGSKCKLHHPKSRSKGKKGRRLQHKNSRGRYFGSICIQASVPGTVVSEKLSALDNDSILTGDIGDYISLDGSGEETREGPTDDQRTFSDSDHTDLPSDDLDKFTKPIRIMDI